MIPHTQSVHTNNTCYNISPTNTTMYYCQAQLSLSCSPSCQLQLSWLSDSHIATLGSIWESCKFKLARSSHKVVLYPERTSHPPCHQTSHQPYGFSWTDNVWYFVQCPRPSVNMWLNFDVQYPSQIVPLFLGAVLPPIIFLCGPPPQNVVVCLCHTWLCLGI